MTELLRVLIADDHPVYRNGLALMLETLQACRVVGHACTGSEAVALAAELQPDVVVMDLNMPELDGIEATRRIVQASPLIGILVLTMFEDDDSVFAAMRAGARGYVLKGADEPEIIRAINAVGHGEAIFGPDIAGKVLSYFLGIRAIGPPAAFPLLTDREREVLELIAKGSDNQSIARRLVLNPKTIRNLVSNIFRKLQVADRAQAIVRAREAGFGKPSSPG